MRTSLCCIGVLSGLLLGAGAWAQSAAKPASAASAPNTAGTINLAEGETRLQTRGGAVRAAKVGDVVKEGDTLVTGKGGEIHLSMQDAGFIAVRPNTRLTISAFQADGADGDKAVFKLLVGGFRAISGWIGKYNQRDYQVHTPTATIGIRGTDHEPHYIPEGSSEGEPGTYDKVYAGETSVQTAAGQTTVTPNQAGFVAIKGGQRPRLLGGIPGFYKPGPHEAEINLKHAQIQQQIVQRREERRKVIVEKRAQLQAARGQAQAQLQQNKGANQQRQQEARQMRQGNQEKREDLQATERSAQALERDAAERRKALREGSPLPPRQAMRERQAIREEAKSAAQLQQQAEAQRKAMLQDTQAAKQQRQQAFGQQHQTMQGQLANVKGQRQSLQQEKADAVQETKTLNQQEQARYRAELRADHRKPAASAASAPKTQAP